MDALKIKRDIANGMMICKVTWMALLDSCVAKDELIGELQSEIAALKEEVARRTSVYQTGKF